MLKGYGGLILDGTLTTISLALLSVVIAIVIGLAVAGIKLFGPAFGRVLADVYTTFIRGVPDLVLMLLIFFGLQSLLNQVTAFFNIEIITIDPFVAGVATLGFIYGAYFAETFRGAFMMVPKGQLESGLAFGLSPGQVFRLILFPQMMRHALPGIGNNWQITLKATALVSIIGLSDLVRAAQVAGKATYDFFTFSLLAAAIYLVLTTLSNILLSYLERRYTAGVRQTAL
jgi:histidine transport system permease protein